MQNIARELHKSVKNKVRGANLHKSVIGDIWIRSIFAIYIKKQKALWKNRLQHLRTMLSSWHGKATLI